MDSRVQNTQVRKVRDMGQCMRVDIEEGGLIAPKETVGKNSRKNLELDCKGCGWITVLPRSQDGTDLYR